MSTTTQSSPTKRAADYRISELTDCFADIEDATESAILHVCYTVNETIEPTNVLMMYVTGDAAERLEAVTEFRNLISVRQLSEDGGLHEVGESWIVVSNSVRWGEKYAFFLAFEED